MNRVQFIIENKILKHKISSFLPRKDDYVELLGKTYVTKKVTINIINDLAIVELSEVISEEISETKSYLGTDK